MIRLSIILFINKSLLKRYFDEASKTRHGCVETCYVIHHIVAGNEDAVVLEHMKDSKVKLKRLDVGEGVRRSIEMNSEEVSKVYFQIMTGENEDSESLTDSLHLSLRLFSSALSLSSKRVLSHFDLLASFL